MVIGKFLGRAAMPLLSITYVDFQNTDGQAAIWSVFDETIPLDGLDIISPNPGPGWTEIGTGDFYVGGRPDILWQNTDGQAAIWEIR
jgi:hypothetical protein